MGDVDFGPGTGMSSIGSHSSLGLDYNLLFSGNYSTSMRGHLNVDWPRSLTITAIPEPMGGMLDVTFGLRMMATLWVAGSPIPLPLDRIIDDMEGHGHAVFDPWRWHFDDTTPLVHLNVSAWRTLYTLTVNVAGSDVDFELQMRYNVDVDIRTVEIGFPDRTSTAAMQPNLAVITETMPVAIYPAPRDGNLDLLTRWKSELRYQGSFEFRVNPSCHSSLDLVCRAATGLLGSVLGTISTPPIATSHQQLPDPFDNMPHFDLPVQEVDRQMIDFGNVHVGETVMDHFVVTSGGRSTLAVDTGASDLPEFTVSPGGCVEAGRTLDVPVTFHPTSVGQFQTEIEVNSNGTVGTPHRITLYGRGVTTSTMRANDAGNADGGANAHSGDGGEYLGPRFDAACGCRTPGSTGRNGYAWLALGAAAVVMANRRKRG
jgi:hypothetical protein